jgi:hypothetical protein
MPDRDRMLKIKPKRFVIVDTLSSANRTRAAFLQTLFQPKAEFHASQPIRLSQDRSDDPENS